MWAHRQQDIRIADIVQPQVQLDVGGHFLMFLFLPLSINVTFQEVLGPCKQSINNKTH